MVALLVIGTILCGGSLLVLARRALRMRRAIPASGTVIYIEPAHEARPAGYFDRVPIPRDVPVLQFETAAGERVVTRCPSTPCGQCSCGKLLSFRYDPRDPQHVVLSSESYWRDLVPFLAIGVLCFVSVLWLR